MRVSYGRAVATKKWGPLCDGNLNLLVYVVFELLFVDISARHLSLPSII